MSSKRLEKIKGARSISDILDVVSEIAYEFKNSAAIVGRLVSSLSAAGVMTFDGRGGRKPANVAPVKTEVDTTYVPPKISELKQHSEVASRLYANVVELDAAEALLKHSFAGQKKQPAALAAVKALKADIDAQINAAFDALNELAHKHQPKKFEAFVDKVKDALISILPVNSYKDIHRTVYVTPDPETKTSVHFCDYLGIESLKNLQGYNYDVYYIIITGVVDSKGSMTVYVNGLPDFKAPGKYPLGKACKDLAAARKHIEMLLDHNSFVVDFEKHPLPFDADRANTAGIPSIKGVVGSPLIEDDSLYVFLAPTIKTEAAADKVRVEVQTRINAIVGSKSNALVFQHKFITKSGKKAVKFILTPNIDKKNGFSLQKLDEASHILGLSDKQKVAFRFALQHDNLKK